MPCFRPLTGYRSAYVNAGSGKRSIVFNRREALPEDHPQGAPITLPCGQCRFCRLEHSRQMALRCLHESSLYEKNCFLTLTYNNQSLPRGGTLDYNAPVLFMKRLRDRYGPSIRSFGCAEYGELLQRPHYHILIFNHDFSDKDLIKGGKYPLFRSSELEKLWPFGHSSIGEVNFETAAYVARYVCKKITGPRAALHYESVDPQSGEVVSRLPERAVCVSRRPGIGRTWAEANAAFVRHHDFVVLRGKKVRPAKYYDRIFDLADPEGFAKVKEKRKAGGERASARLEEESAAAFARYWKKGGSGPMPEHRLYVLEKCLELKFQEFKRGYENETESVLRV